MDPEKDIRYTEKKIDESWKEHMIRDKAKMTGQTDDGKRTSDPEHERRRAEPTSRHFVNLVSSLGYQAMVQLGELPDPSTQASQINLDAAREIINLLAALKLKTAGNLSDEEMRLLNNLLTELQLKFSQKI